MRCSVIMTTRMSKHVCFKTLAKSFCWIGKYFWKSSNYQNFAISILYMVSPKTLCIPITVHEIVSEIRNKLSTVSFTGRWLAKRLWLAMCSVFNRILLHKLCGVWDCHRTGTLGMILCVWCFVTCWQASLVIIGCHLVSIFLMDVARKIRQLTKVLGSAPLCCVVIMLCWDFCSVRLKCIAFENIDSGSDVWGESEKEREGKYRIRLRARWLSRTVRTYYICRHGHQSYGGWWIESAGSRLSCLRFVNRFCVCTVRLAVVRKCQEGIRNVFPVKICAHERLIDLLMESSYIYPFLCMFV